MATSTTANNACDVETTMQDATGVLRDISGSTNSMAMNWTHMIGDHRVFGDKWPQRLECGKDTAWTYNVTYDRTSHTGFQILRDWYFAATPGLRTVHVFIPNDAVGVDHYYGNFRIQSLNWTLDPADPKAIAVTAEIVPSGEVCFTITTT